MRKRTLLPIFSLVILSLVALSALWFKASSPRLAGSVGSGPIEFAPDSRSLLAVTSSTFDRLDLTTGRWQSLPKFHQRRPTESYYQLINSYAGLPDGKSGLMATSLGTFLFRADEPQLKLAWPEVKSAGHSPVYAVAVSPNGQLMAGGHHLTVWATRAEGNNLAPSHRLWSGTKALDPPAVLRFSPSGDYLAIGYFTGRVEVRNSRTGNTAWVNPAPTPPPIRGFSYMVTNPLGKPNNISYYGQPGAEKIVFPMTFLSEERLAYCNGSGTFIVDATTGRVIHTIPRPRARDLAAFSNGRTLALASLKVELWDARTGQLQHTLFRSSNSFHLAISPDQKHLAASESDETGVGELKLWTLR